MAKRKTVVDLKALAKLDGLFDANQQLRALHAKVRRTLEELGNAVLHEKAITEGPPDDAEGKVEFDLKQIMTLRQMFRVVVDAAYAERTETPAPDGWTNRQRAESRWGLVVDGTSFRYDVKLQGERVYVLKLSVGAARTLILYLLKHVMPSLTDDNSFVSWYRKLQPNPWELHPEGK